MTLEDRIATLEQRLVEMEQNSYLPILRLEKNGDDTILTTDTPITWNAVEESDPIFLHDTASGDPHVTVSVGGKYLVLMNLGIRLTAGTTRNIVETRMQFNLNDGAGWSDTNPLRQVANNTAYWSYHRDSTSAQGHGVASFARIVELAGGSSIRFVAYKFINADTAQTGGGASYFQIIRIGGPDKKGREQ